MYEFMEACIGEDEDTFYPSGQPLKIVDVVLSLPHRSRIYLAGACFRPAAQDITDDSSVSGHRIELVAPSPWKLK